MARHLFVKGWGSESFKTFYTFLLSRPNEPNDTGSHFGQYNRRIFFFYLLNSTQIQTNVKNVIDYNYILYLRQHCV